MSAATQEPEKKYSPVETYMADHRKNMAERQAARDAKRDEMLLCMNPFYAAKRELEKPVFKFRVEADWMGQGTEGATRFNGNEVVVAKSETEAWAAFCDRLQTWPSIRNVHLKITRMDEVSATDALAGTAQDAGIPTKTLVPLRKSMTL